MCLEFDMDWVKRLWICGLGVFDSYLVFQRRFVSKVGSYFRLKYPKESFPIFVNGAMSL